MTTDRSSRVDSGAKTLAKRFRSLSLKTRIISVVILLFLAGIWGLAYRVAAILENDLERLLSEQLEMSAGFVAGDIDARIRARLDRLREIAKSITPDMLAEPKRIQHLLEERDIPRSFLSLGIHVTNRDGINIAEYPHVEGRLGASETHLPTFHAIMAGAEHAIGGPLQGRFVKHTILALAVPLHDAAGGVAGMVAAPVVTSDVKVFGLLEKIKVGESGYFLVLSPREHLIVAATDASRVMQPTPAKGINPLLDRRLEEGYEGVGRTVASTGIEVLTAGKTVPSTGWMVLAALPTAKAFAPIATIKREIYLVALLLSLVLVLVLHTFLSRQLGRLKHVADAMQQMTEGTESQQPLAVTHEDEIGDLKKSFNRLLAERTRLEQALRGEIAARKLSEETLQDASTRLQAFSQRVIKVQENERRKIASELHEQLAQELTTLNLHLQLLKSRRGDEAADTSLLDALAIAEMELKHVREMAARLHPSELEDFGLLAGLRAHCAHQAATHNWRMHFSAPKTLARASREVEHACFRAAQEALINIESHPGTSEVWVDLQCSGDGLQLTVRDDGIGFDPAAAGESAGFDGLGLHGIRERVEQAGGRVSIASNPGAGTEVRAVFPRSERDLAVAPSPPSAG